MNLEVARRSAHKRQRHHSITEMVEFYDEKPVFHAGAGF
jgi:hypothetical protein